MNLQSFGTFENWTVYSASTATTTSSLLKVVALAYSSVPIKEAAQDKSAIITPLGLYKYLRMSFGLVNAPSVFQPLWLKLRQP